MTHLDKHLLESALALMTVFLLLSMQTLHAENSTPVKGIYEGKHFDVSYESGIKPLPLNRMHWWDIAISTKDGKPVDNATISVYGGMPAHHHGLPTLPEASPTGNGQYIIKGLKFSMTGAWEVWLDITADGVNEKVVFKLTL
jgi:hypothetical protein